MINFIIYEDDKELREIYVNCILKMIGNSKIAYEIHEFSKYSNASQEIVSKSIGKKIYILDIEVPGKSGLDYAREIRDNGDWNSPIIVVTAHEATRFDAFNSRTLLLSFISKNNNLKKDLHESLKVAYKISLTNKSLTIKYDGEIYKILYHDILFIEKEINKAECRIVTKDNEMKTTTSITNLMRTLQDDPRFFKTHRGCIINLDNVTGVELVENLIKFKDKETYLLARDKKKELKEKLSKLIGD